MSHSAQTVPQPAGLFVPQALLDDVRLKPAERDAWIKFRSLADGDGIVTIGQESLRTAGLEHQILCNYQAIARYRVRVGRVKPAGPIGNAAILAACGLEESAPKGRLSRQQGGESGHISPRLAKPRCDIVIVSGFSCSGPARCCRCRCLTVATFRC